MDNMAEFFVSSENLDKYEDGGFVLSRHMCRDVQDIYEEKVETRRHKRDTELWMAKQKRLKAAEYIFHNKSTYDVVEAVKLHHFRRKIGRNREYDSMVLGIVNTYEAIGHISDKQKMVLCKICAKIKDFI